MPEKKNIKKLVFQAQYVSEDLEETTEKFMEFKEQFYKDFPDEYKKMLEHADKNKDDSKDDEAEEKKPTPTKEMKKLYRRISKITHPDKIDSEVLNDYFSQASEAYEECDIATLFVIASTLKIYVKDIDASEVSGELEKYIKDGTVETDKLKSTLAWCWAQAETEEEKEQIRAQIKKHVEENY
jgi:hypothetical protein